MTKETGGPAFPTGTQCSQNNTTGETLSYQYLSDGLTLRDYFAGQAMQGICASGPTLQDAHIAGEAYSLADAMLEARK